MLCNLVLVYKTWLSIRRILIKLDQLLTPPLQCTSFASSRQPWATPLVAASLILTMNSLWTSISFPSFHLISLFLLSPFLPFPFLGYLFLSITCTPFTTPREYPLPDSSCLYVSPVICTSCFTLSISTRDYSNQRPQSSSLFRLGVRCSYTNLWTLTYRYYY